MRTRDYALFLWCAMGLASDLSAQDRIGEAPLRLPFVEQRGANPAANPPVTDWLYAVDLGSADGSSTLFRLGITAQQGFVGLEEVGETHVADVFDIAFMGERLFGIGPGSRTFGTSDDFLIEIDPNTAASTVIGTLRPSGHFNALVGETASTMLAATSSGELWRLNPDALTATRLGAYGNGLGSSGDLSFSGGALFGLDNPFSLDRLLRVDATNGHATVVGSVGFRSVWGLATEPQSGALFAVVSADNQPRLAKINKSTGAASVVGRIPAPDVAGLAARVAQSATCTPSSTVHCLVRQRFRVTVEWETVQGAKGAGRALGFKPTLDDSGAFWFFDSNNVELVVKVLDACSISGHYWVFAGGLTNVKTRIRVEDTTTGVVRTYPGSQGVPFKPVQDTAAFATCP